MDLSWLNPEGEGTTELFPIGVTLAGVFVVSLAYFGFTKNRILWKHGDNTTTGRGRRLYPKAQAGMLRTISAMGGSRVPFFLLDTSKEMKSKSFYLNLPFESPLVIGDYLLQRRIFGCSDKPHKLLRSFEISLGGPSLFGRTNAEAAPMRKALAKAFHSGLVQKMDEIAQAHLEWWIHNRLLPAAEAGETFDPAIEFLDVAFATICEAALDYTSENIRQEARDFRYHIENTGREFSFRELSNPLRPCLYYISKERREAFRSAAWVQNFAKKVLIEYRKKEIKRPNTIISIIECEQELGLTTDQEKIPEILVWLVAGHDTTGYSLATLLLHLAQSPNQVQTIRASLLNCPRSKWSSLPEVANAIKESIRLAPTTAMISVRRTTKDLESEDGYLVPSGTLTFLPQYLANHDDELYPYPDQFRPDRWKDATPAMEAAFMPFAVGPRNCIGQKLGKVQLHNVVPRLISQFDFEVVDQGRLEFFVTLKPVGVQLKVKKL